MLLTWLLGAAFDESLAAVRFAGKDNHPGAVGRDFARRHQFEEVGLT